MAKVTATEFQNNIGQVINTIPREPVIVTKHGKNYGVFLRYSDPIEFGYADIENLSEEAREMYEDGKKLEKSAFIDF
jgi:prevent-host-death family protein